MGRGSQAADHKQVDEKHPNIHQSPEAAHFLGAGTMLAGGLNISHRRLTPCQPLGPAE